MISRSSLADAAARGCDVKLLYDSVGSWRIEQRHIQPIIDAGGEAIPFRPFVAAWPWRWSLSVLNRNHRKILIPDACNFTK